MLKKIVRIKFVFLIFTSIVLISALNFIGFYLFLEGPLEKNRSLIIEKNLSTYKISQKLKENHIVEYQYLFFVIAKLFSLKFSIKSGEYMFTEKIAPMQVLKILASGKSILHKITFPEGVTVSWIIDKINSDPLLAGEIIGKIPEGFLMPSTYFYSYGDRREQIVEKMRNLTSEILDKLEPLMEPDSPIKNRKDLLILASIIEKETSLDEEKPIIAGVFINRLKKNMKLQADPTTIYALTEGKYILDRPLSKIDLGVKSPYNTYYVKGLPPGAICCPGKKSLEAVVRPAKTKALYFVSNGKGGHNFAEDLNLHNKNFDSYKKTLKTSRDH